MEELGQTFEIKFFAPLSAGGCQRGNLAARVAGSHSRAQRYASRKPYFALTLRMLGASLIHRCASKPLFAGKYDLQLLCMPDSWVGCDKAVPIRLKVS